MHISTILDHIDNGHMALPEFQRGYVWNRDQVRGLFDSLYRRHPVGGLLVWPIASAGRFGEADSGFAVEDDMQVPDHAGCLQQGVSHVVIAAPSVFDRQGEGMDVDDTVATGTGGNSDRFAHFADCRCVHPLEIFLYGKSQDAG